MSAPGSALPNYPRVVITYCTQCRWMLRAAYFGQELLSTFGVAIGEVALVPSTGGTFIVEIHTVLGSKTLWDRGIDGGFPETKELKRRLRDVIEPGRNLGHVDGKKNAVSENTEVPKVNSNAAEVDITSKTEERPSDEAVLTQIQTDNVPLPPGAVCEDCQP